MEAILIPRETRINVTPVQIPKGHLTNIGLYMLKFAMGLVFPKHAISYFLLLSLAL